MTLRMFKCTTWFVSMLALGIFHAWVGNPLAGGMFLFVAGMWCSICIHCYLESPERPNAE